MTGHMFSVTNNEVDKLIAEHAKLHKAYLFQVCYNFIGLKQIKSTSNKIFNRVASNKKKCNSANDSKTKQDNIR